MGQAGISQELTYGWSFTLFSVRVIGLLANRLGIMGQGRDTPHPGYGRAEYCPVTLCHPEQTISFALDGKELRQTSRTVVGQRVGH